MNQEDVLFGFLWVLMLLSAKAKGQSPCPGIFDYQRDGSGIHGLIRLQPESHITTTKITTYFTVATQLLTKYIGSLKPTDKTNPKGSIEPGELATYRVTFPVETPVPRLTTLIFNDEVLCYGSGDVPKPNQVISTFSLEYNSNGTQQDFENIIIPELIGSTTEECGIISIVATNDDMSGIKELRDFSSWPWAVAIFEQTGLETSYLSAGTLVTDRHVLSGAEEVANKRRRENKVLVKTGVYDLFDLTEEFSRFRSVSKITVHEQYDYDTYENSVMVLTLRNRVIFNHYVRPICLWDENKIDLSSVVGLRGVVTGWSFSVNDAKGPSQLHSITMPIVSNEACLASKSEFSDYVYDTTYCAGDRNGTGICDGDLGGGFYLQDPDDKRWKIRGIVSTGLYSGNNTYCNMHHYVVFTDAAKYLPWIKNVISMT